MIHWFLAQPLSLILSEACISLCREILKGPLSSFEFESTFSGKLFPQSFFLGLSQGTFISEGCFIPSVVTQRQIRMQIERGFAETRMQMLGAHIPLHSPSLWFACLPLRGLFPQGRQKDSCASCTSLTALVKRFKKWMIRNFWKSLHLCPWILTYYLNILSESSRSRSNMCSLKSTVSSGSWHSQFCKTSQDGKQYPSLMT